MALHASYNFKYCHRVILGHAVETLLRIFETLYLPKLLVKNCGFDLR